MTIVPTSRLKKPTEREVVEEADVPCESGFTVTSSGRLSSARRRSYTR
jgi:hypothetical protein